MEKMTTIEMEEGSNILHWAVINAVTKLGALEKIWPKFPEDGKWEMKLIMSGVELPIMDTFKELESQIDNMVADKAKEIINDKFSDLFSGVEDILEDNKDRIFNEIEIYFKGKTLSHET